MSDQPQHPPEGGSLASRPIAGLRIEEQTPFSWFSCVCTSCAMARTGQFHSGHYVFEVLGMLTSQLQLRDALVGELMNIAENAARFAHATNSSHNIQSFEECHHSPCINTRALLARVREAEGS